MTQKTITLPAFGSVIPGQGGIFAAIFRGPIVNGIQQSPIALIASDAAHEIKSIWGTYRQDVTGCGSRTDGHANTLAMLAADCAAAKHARSITVDGLNDFYLPSIGELNTAAANAPELFDPKGVYWSSTQDSALCAFAQDFEDGFSYWLGKDVEFRVRPFRAIPLHTLNA